MDFLHTPPATVSLQSLRDRLHGAVVAPGEADYDQARLAWNLAVHQYPALIVRAESAYDVAEAVSFARQVGLGVAVQSTGHGVVRPANDALLILTSSMNNVRVDAMTQTAWVEAGALWGAVLEKAQSVGLAPLLGSSPGVGAVGYTLGGGLGWLARKYGLAADSALAFEVVTADGRVLRASAGENSDLFWALCGGGGGFGVVTGMEIRLYPVTTVYGGNLIYPAEVAKEAFARYRDWITTLPEDFTTAIALANLPPLPQFPEPLRGKSILSIRGLYAGAPEQGEALLRYWLDWKQPMVNQFQAMPFSQVAAVSNDPKDPVPGYGTGAWLTDLSDETIDTVIRMGVGPSPIMGTEIRHIAGAMGRVNPQANAFSYRSSSLLMHLVGMAPTPEARQAAEAYASQYKAALQPHLTGQLYLNFVEGGEAVQRTQDAYLPETYRRLKAVKASYDPDNRFHFSYDIPPVKEA